MALSAAAVATSPWLVLREAEEAGIEKYLEGALIKGLKFAAAVTCHQSTSYRAESNPPSFPSTSTRLRLNCNPQTTI